MPKQLFNADCLWTGMFVQKVYPIIPTYSGRLSSISETDRRYANETARNLVVKALGPQWNFGRPVLLERSSMHCVMMRLLQYYFNQEQTSFVIPIRHPFATMKRQYSVPEDEYPWNNCGDHCECGKAQLLDWINVMSIIMSDISFLENAVIIPFDQFIGDGKSQGVFLYHHRLLT